MSLLFCFLSTLTIYHHQNGLFQILNFQKKWKIILTEKVAFYNALSNKEKKLFEYKIHEFLLNCDVIGVKTSVNITDKLLIASSAVIPIFNFPNWKYPNIKEVILYPDMFNQHFETEGDNRRILGMVGNGYLDNKMILSKLALHLGFDNESDKKILPFMNLCI